jgi:hypothetical protein
MYIPVPATIHAMMAPSGPVAFAKVRGSEKIPAPIIDPTTIEVKAKRENFCVDPDVIVTPPSLNARVSLVPKFC